MEHNIGIYDCPFNIQGHEDARLYHKASLGIVEDERYNTKLGIYKEGCGFENVTMSWGHDEYLYQVLKNHMAKVKTEIPDEGMWGIRFHSCYPWHTGEDYKHLMNEKDKDIMIWVLEFK